MEASATIFRPQLAHQSPFDYPLMGNSTNVGDIVRGYFGIGAEEISKPMNMGNIIRSGHAFGASFVFTVNAFYTVRSAKSDTSKTPNHLPYYEWETVGDMVFPKTCQLVGIELTEDAIELPSFRHPLNAAYVLGPERGSLSGEMIERCDHIIKIPTSFCLNVQIAGAIVMYDRVKSMGNYPDRALMPGGPNEDKKVHQHGGRFLRSTKPRPSTAHKK